MPIYEYRCLKCGHQFEKMQKIADQPVSRCEKCNERVTRVFHPVAIHFKGSGFYSTDYAKKRPSSAKPSGEKTGDSSGEPSSEKSGDRSGEPSSEKSGDRSSEKKDKHQQSRNSRKKAAAGGKDS